jgi:pimeloyl-ACP methyl ester carboxylesterase
MQPAPVVILVHGAWHGPWVWAEVRQRLTAAGIRSLAVDLPSKGPDTASLGDLHDDAEAVRAAVAGAGGPAVVVAHSYGGLPVTEGLADSADVMHLVYLTAFMIEPRETLLGLRGGVEPPWWLTSEDGRTLLPDNPQHLFFNDCPPEVAERAAAAIVPQRKDVFRQEIFAAAWQHVPSTYVICGRDNAVAPALQEGMAERAGTVSRIDSGHSAFLSRPGDVTAIIQETLATVSARG